MKRWLPVTITALLLLSLTPDVLAIPRGTKVKRFRGHLAFPVDMAWVKGTKKVFFTQKGGAVRVLNGRRLLTRACVTLDVNAAGERGALGIALHPRFKNNHYLYVYYTNASPLEHRVTRFRVKNNRCRKPKHIVKHINASSSGYHNGGQLEFVGGKLFISTGEAHSPSLAQDRNNRLGKILRYNPNGTIPNNNPFGNRNPVWSYGHRNPFGLARRPGTKRLYETENGPNCDDELNLIKKGRNYGWGSGYSCGTNGVGPNPKGPLRRYSSIVIPTDPYWYSGKLRAMSGSLYMGDFNGALHRFKFRKNGKRLRSDRIVYRASNGIVDVSKGPKGWLYFLTPRAIYRIVRD
jgi:glucose/arabinose dehydrogenase